MIVRLTDWWRGRSPREQRLLAIMFVLVFIVLGWLLVIRPLGDTLAAARERHQRAVVALAEARAQAAAIGRLEKVTTVPLAGSLTLAVSAAANEAGFQVSRIQPDGDDRVTLSLASARPQALFGWISRLERERGLVVERLNVTTNSDKTVGAEMTLRKRGE